MRIIFIRHGEPSYETGGLTEKGHAQAAAVAERLVQEGIQQIYSSTLVRALETAEYTAEKLNISEIIPCEFMCELIWKISRDGRKLNTNLGPWGYARNMVAKGQSLLDADWAVKPPFCKITLPNLAEKAAIGFDELLASFGYQREGDYYRVLANSDKTIAVFSHCASSSAVLGHLFNLPFPFLCSAMVPKHTAVTIINLSGEEGSLVAPGFEICNDSRHIVGIDGNTDCLGG